MTTQETYQNSKINYNKRGENDNNGKIHFSSCKYYYTNLQKHILNDIARIHFEYMNILDRDLVNMRQKLILKSLENETKIENLNFKNTDIDIIVELLKGIEQLVRIREILIPIISQIFNLYIVNDRKIDKRNNYYEDNQTVFPNFNKIKSDILINFENYIKQLESAKSDIKIILKDKRSNNYKNKHKFKKNLFNNIVISKIDELVSISNNTLQILKNAKNINELLELKFLI